MVCGPEVGTASRRRPAHPVVPAGKRLQLGLLVGRDDELAGVEQCAAIPYGYRNDGAEAMALVDRAAAVAATVPDDEGPAWSLDTVRAQALWLTGRHPEAEALLRPRLEAAEPGSWRQFWAETKMADLALDAGRHAEALVRHGPQCACGGPSPRR